MDPEIVTQWIHYGLMWIGFGTLVGLLAKAITPGKDPGGALATVVIGILGSLVGAGLLAYFANGIHVSPISLLGFVVALGGTTLLLFTYRLLNATSMKNFTSGIKWKRARPRRVAVVEE